MDAHTHLTGQESAEQALECLDAVGVEKAFVFAPMLDVQAHEITSDSMGNIRTHNDYCADICSKASERLLGFCTLNPMCPPSRAATSTGRWTSTSRRRSAVTASSQSVRTVAIGSQGHREPPWSDAWSRWTIPGR